MNWPLNLRAGFLLILMKLLIWSFVSHMPLNNLHMNYSLTFKRSISYFSRVCVHKCCMALSSLCNSIIDNVFIPEMFSSFTQTFLRLIHVLLHSLFVYPFFCWWTLEPFVALASIFYLLTCLCMYHCTWNLHILRMCPSLGVEIMSNCFSNVLTPINTPASRAGTFSVAPHTLRNLETPLFRQARKCKMKSSYDLILPSSELSVLKSVFRSFVFPTVWNIYSCHLLIFLPSHVFSGWYLRFLYIV